MSRTIHHCVTCRRLRRPTQTQKMANLPADRLCTEPPFTNIGLDVFGPWSVSSRRTRGGLAHSKRWAVIFTCMSTRAVHIEVVESLDTSSFINALRRFFSIRGPAKHIRSDHGTNFIGACKELKIASNIRTTSVEKIPDRTGLHLDVQSPSCLTYGWGLGKDDRYSKEDSGFYVPSARALKANPRSTHHLDGRSGRHHQCQTTCPSIYRPR